MAGQGQGTLWEDIPDSILGTVVIIGHLVICILDTVETELVVGTLVLLGCYYVQFLYASNSFWKSNLHYHSKSHTGAGADCPKDVHLPAIPYFCQKAFLHLKWRPCLLAVSFLLFHDHSIAFAFLVRQASFKVCPFWLIQWLNPTDFSLIPLEHFPLCPFLWLKASEFFL